MKIQQLLSLIRQAVQQYDMIQDGDHIAIGISGGKDSLTLLHGLHRLQKFYSKQFHITAITVDLGLGNMELESVKRLCQQLEIPYEIISTDIGTVLFDIRKEKNPCSLCAKMRKGVFNTRALELGCNKVAYAHHKDDLIETAMLSLIYEGRFHSFSPYTILDRTGLAVIRPLLFVTEREIRGFQKKYQLTVCKNPCPIDGYTKRQYVKNWIKTLEYENPGVKDRLFRAVVNGNLDGWPKSTFPENTPQK